MISQFLLMSAKTTSIYQDSLLWHQLNYSKVPAQNANLTWHSTPTLKMEKRYLGRIKFTEKGFDLKQFLLETFRIKTSYFSSLTLIW